MRAGALDLGVSNPFLALGLSVVALVMGKTGRTGAGLCVKTSAVFAQAASSEPIMFEVTESVKCGPGNGALRFIGTGEGSMSIDQN